MTLHMCLGTCAGAQRGHSGWAKSSGSVLLCHGVLECLALLWEPSWAG